MEENKTKDMNPQLQNLRVPLKERDLSTMTTVLMNKTAEIKGDDDDVMLRM